MSSLLALTMRMGISSCSRSLRQIVFVSVDVNGIFSFGEENKILLWGQEGNQPPAGITAATMTVMKIGTINMMRCEISSRLFTVIVSPCIVSAFTLSQMIDSFNKKGRV